MRALIVLDAKQDAGVHTVQTPWHLCQVHVLKQRGLLLARSGATLLESQWLVGRLIYRDYLQQLQQLSECCYQEAD